MANQTHLTSDKNDTNQASYSTASISPSTNALILISILSRAASGATNEPTVSGCGLTWVKVGTIPASDNTNRITVFRAMGSPSAGALTIDFGGQNQSYCNWSVSEFTAVNTSGANGAGAVVQFATATDEATNTGLTINLAAFGNANNAVYGAVRSGNAVTPGSGFTEIAEPTGEAILQTQWKASADTSVDWTWSSTASFALGIALEIKSILSSTNTESVSVSDSLLKAPQRLLSETVSAADTILRNVLRTLSESTAIGNVFESLKVITATMTLEAISLGNTLLRSIVRTLAETPAVADTALKSSSRTLADAATITDTLVKTANKLASEVVSLADSILRAITRTAEETLTLTQAYLTSISRSISEALSIGDVLTRGLTYVRTLIESLTITDYIKQFLNGLSVRYSSKFTARGSSYDSKYTARGSGYEEKYPPR